MVELKEGAAAGFIRWAEANLADLAKSPMLRKAAEIEGGITGRIPADQVLICIDRHAFYVIIQIEHFLVFNCLEKFCMVARSCSKV